MFYENNTVLSQLKVAEKTNVITAIPKLLDDLIIEGSIITIESIGTQKKIASHIMKNGAN